MEEMFSWVVLSFRRNFKRIPKRADFGLDHLPLFKVFPGFAQGNPGIHGYFFI